MVLSFKRIERSTITEDIIEQLREKILSGEIKPGDKLPPERVLAESLSVARTSVREAIRAMQYMGILEVRCGEGTFLSENTRILTDHFKSSHLLKRFPIMELIEARKIIEGATVYLAVVRSSPEDRDTLQELYQLTATNTDDEEKFLQADFEFHKKIAEMSQNSVLLEMLSAMRELTLEENLDVIKKPGQIKNALDFHRKILGSVLSCDADKAREHMLRHLEDIEQRILELVESRPSDEESDAAGEWQR
ncbi:MAG TPA: FadR/GntR family transcriptional regulator [Synergistales bacterium]|jgi:GntR family transcriptional repressor for pyruvate dehydrogenase complex|nr:FadR/GntR family transcriptional regulator [Synergistales bacterium]MDI9393136.1 FadR/GntR family transcriptional regulator [Synergistota bacterium]NLV65992.1 FadR family transcriptional regulator [Synergistaceae bacterium]MDD3830739.1 FadR/GntR family transcriptional regulator [Synergistales bacterium]MDD4024277.1 FadR/GntR family transcriptional regulator [Synergistales bacterium]